jgi:hypothetical protein
MKSVAQVLLVGLVGAGLIGVAGCTVESPTYVTTQEDSDGGATTSTVDNAATGGGAQGGGSSSSGAAGATSTCGTNDYVKADLSKLTACGNGKGHCFDKTKADMASQFAACPDPSQVCVPDEILEADGQKLTSCTSIIGPGGCITAALIPQLEAQGGSSLKQDVCAAGQLCTPCNDPTNNNAPTPFCQPIGVHANACAAPAAGADGGAAADSASPLKACCTTNGKSNGVCLAEAAIPASQQSQTKQDVCDTGDKCVPAAFVEGKPVTCDGGLLGSGVCMDKCFNDMLGIAGDVGILSSKGCGTTELCIPCSFVSSQGVPGCK